MSDDLSDRISQVKNKVKERVKQGTQSASERVREDYHGVRQQAQETVEEAREQRQPRERSGLKNLQRTTEMADPMNTTLDPATAPENVQYLVTGPPGTHHRGDDLVTGGSGKTEAEDMVTNGFGGDSFGGGSVDPLVDPEFGLADSSSSGTPDDDLVLPGEGGFEW